jgi:hypothetical protein
MTYEEFLDLPTSVVDDLCKLVSIKNKYDLDFTDEEKELGQHLLTYWEEMKTNESRYKLEKCWEIGE